MTNKSNQTKGNRKSAVQDTGKKEQAKKTKTSKKKDIKKTSSYKTQKTKAKNDTPDKKEEKKLREEIELIKGELTQIQDKYLRLSADFDNYRKRTLREKAELTKTANAEMLLNILPIIDDLERAINSMEEDKNCKAMKDGIDIIYNKFSEFLKSSGVKEVEAMHKKFDTDLHEAVTKIPASKKKHKGMVVDVIQKGYYLNEKIIRYPKVVVGE